MNPESTRIRPQKRAKSRAKPGTKKSLRTADVLVRDAQLDAAAARPKNARARREPDSPMPQACPEDAPVISSSKSKIFKFFFFPAECQLAGWETRFFFSNECIICKHPASGVPGCTPLMQPRARSHMPTRMGPHSEIAPAGACRNVTHSTDLARAG